jgi:hypothetical protein
MDEQRTLSQWQLTVVPDDLPSCTTLLQSGFRVCVPSGQTLLGTLTSLPGFSEEYLSATVQTIFCNGVPVDDLHMTLPGQGAVIALSAAMPGLAGAIFRKNSIHAPLRGNAKGLVSQAVGGCTVFTLKLFNSIALERGTELLCQGVVMTANTVASFLEKRPDLAASIVAAYHNQQRYPLETMISRLLGDTTDIELRIAVEKRPTT